MQWWLYRGRVTTPIDIPGKGPTVLRPRDKFQAPYGAVAHLKRIGTVVACKPPKEELKRLRAEAQAPKSAAPAPEAIERAASEPASVVTSESEPQATVEEEKPVEASVEEPPKDEEEPKEKAPEEKPKEKEKGKKRRRK